MVHRTTLTDSAAADIRRKNVLEMARFKAFCFRMPQIVYEQDSKYFPGERTVGFRDINRGVPDGAALVGVYCQNELFMTGEEAKRMVALAKPTPRPAVGDNEDQF